jgi:hypothetical protein
MQRHEISAETARPSGFALGDGRLETRYGKFGLSTLSAPQIRPGMIARASFFWPFAILAFVCLGLAVFLAARDDLEAATGAGFGFLTLGLAAIALRKSRAVFLLAAEQDGRMRTLYHTGDFDEACDALLALRFALNAPP